MGRIKQSTRKAFLCVFYQCSRKTINSSVAYNFVCCFVTSSNWILLFFLTNETLFSFFLFDYGNPFSLVEFVLDETVRYPGVAESVEITAWKVWRNATWTVKILNRTIRTFFIVTADLSDDRQQCKQCRKWKHFFSWGASTLGIVKQCFDMEFIALLAEKENRLKNSGTCSNFYKNANKNEHQPSFSIYCRRPILVSGNCFVRDRPYVVIFCVKVQWKMLRV